MCVSIAYHNYVIKVDQVMEQQSPALTTRGVTH